MADELTKEEEKMDWYGVLGLSAGAEETAISKAFKKMSLKWHPDKNAGSQEAHDMFMRIKEAKLFLLDGKKRNLYDEKRAARHKMESLLVSFFISHLAFLGVCCLLLGQFISSLFLSSHSRRFGCRSA